MRGGFGERFAEERGEKSPRRHSGERDGREMCVLGFEMRLTWRCVLIYRTESRSLSLFILFTVILSAFYCGDW